jgi:hypothetical protein
MGDAGEGLIDAEARIAERMEELERARNEKRAPAVRDPERLQALESLRLARTELQHQLDTTTHDRRRAGLVEAIRDVDQRMAVLSAPVTPPQPSARAKASAPKKRQGRGTTKAARKGR